jgi:hypothetical protein
MVSTSGLIVSTAPQKSHKVKGWLFAAVATGLSTYALDGVATAGGMLLVGSGVMAEVGEIQLLWVLAGTYVAWGAGLRVNLKANFRLLEEVGTSSNALSKGAYDVVSFRTEAVRPRKVAAAVGYVGTELAKEVPYYAAALGAAFVSDTITSHDALVFLAGTNLGAAVYEYGLGRVTRAYLHRRATRTMPLERTSLDSLG